MRIEDAPEFQTARNAMSHHTNAIIRCPLCGTLNRVDLDRANAGPRCGSCRKPILLDRPLPATQSDFDRTIGSSPVPVLVDFYADWCGPCHMIAPHLEAIAAARAGKALVLKVDSDAEPGLAARFGIRGLPTVVAFRDGKETGRQVGAASREAYEQLLGVRGNTGA
jgi:thioredoxin 2